MGRRKQPSIPDELLDQLLAGGDPRDALAGQDGLLDALKKALASRASTACADGGRRSGAPPRAERALNAGMDHHLEGGEPDGRANSRNRYGRKTVLTETGRMELEVPRDRLSTFDPVLVAKYRRRLPGFDEKVVSLYARGLSVREIQGPLRELYGIEASADLVSAVTDAVLD